jgi:mono/diheme cytochrome c family protein
LALLGLTVSQLVASAQSVAPTRAAATVRLKPDTTEPPRLVLDRYCVTCHNERLKTAGLTLDQIDIARPGARAEEWEKVVRKIRTGAMPPANAPQPSVQDRIALVSWLESSLDTAAAAHPNPGRTDTLRRLNRTEYQNAIRDLLSLDIDAASLLPPDDSGHGFDNVTVGDLSPALLDRYISTAQKISRLAIGGAQTAAQTDVIRLAPDLTQEEHVPGLPVGTRGGVSSAHTFTHDGEYDIQIWLARDRTGSVGGLRGSTSHELLVLVDRTLVKSMTIEMPPDGDDTSVDAALKVRVPVTAGSHQVGVTFVKNAASLLETARQPLLSHFNENRHPRLTPAIAQVSITGPFAAKAAGDTPARRRIFVCRPDDARPSTSSGRPEPAEGRKEDACAKQILSTLMRRAYRRQIAEADLKGPMVRYREGRSEADFDAGIGRALSAVLVSPEFLFRVELDPERAAAGAAYRISDLELASRLSFFLWSSLPDEELLDAAIRGTLSRPDELERQARRMLADRRSYNLASNFAGQWLGLRSLEALDPNVRLYPDFDDNLRQAFRQETELFVDSILREDRSVRDLIRADYTFLNERLAKHYGIPHVYGSRFRRVALAPGSARGGLLRHGSILAVTSYATRTSPVLRGVWVLDNIFGAPPPPPPANVPALDDTPVAASLPMRQRLGAHRANPACASCHRTIDPVGFALENFDAVGRWRNDDGDSGPVDVSGALPGAVAFRGVAGLEESLLSRPELFAGRLTEKLLTFALGRGVEYYDAPAVRKILRDAEPGGYRLSSILLGIVKSVPFQMRRSS